MYDILYLNIFEHMKAYSQDLRDRVIDLFVNKKYSRTQICRLMDVSYSTVCTWVKSYLKTGDYSSRQHLAPGRKARFDDKQAVLSFIEANPDADGVEIRDAVAPGLPMSTFYDSLKRMEITYKKRA